MLSQQEILSIINTILTTLIGYPYVLMFIDKFRYSKKKTTLITISFFTLMIIYNLALFNIFGITSNAKIIIATSNLILCFFLTLLIALYQKGYVCFLYFNATIFVHFANIISGNIGPDTSYRYLFSKIAASCAMLLLLFYFFKPVFFEIKNQYYRHWYLLSLFPICTFMFFSLLVLKLGLFEESTTSAILALLLVIPVICLYMIIFNIMYTIKKNSYSEENSHILQVQEKAFQEMLERMAEQEKKHSILRHDIRHYGNLIAACITNRQYEEALTGITTLCNQLDKISLECSSRKYCLNTAVNIVITPLIERAKHEGIVVSVQISLPEKINVNVTELCIVLSNCIENAINACLKIPEPANRRIMLSIKKAGCQIYIECKNTYMPPLTFDCSGLPITSEEGHGYGTRSIQAFVEKNHAILDFSAAEDGWFRVSIIV